MPFAFTPDATDTERKAPTGGGKPPAEHRPTGGGGGGGDDGNSWLPSGPRALLKTVRAFVFCALASDMVFFLVLVFLFYARQSGTHLDPRMLRQVRDWHPVMMPPILFLNSSILMVSILTMARARYHIFAEFDVIEEWLGMGRPALRRALLWMGGTLILGLLFLAGQWIAWKQLTEVGFEFDRDATAAAQSHP